MYVEIENANVRLTVFRSCFPIKTFLGFGYGGRGELKVDFLPFGGWEANIFVDLINGRCLQKHVGSNYVTLFLFVEILY